jgi:hypothetical protein
LLLDHPDRAAFIEQEFAAFAPERFKSNEVHRCANARNSD